MISIIIPTLNEEKLLPRLLESLREQSCQGYEIIISDGNSEDRTVEIAERYGCRIVLSNKKKRHPSIQRNSGAQIARGEIFLFLDADTTLPDKYFLENTLNEFKKRSLGAAGFYIDFQSKKFFYRFYRRLYNGLACLAQCIKPLALGAGIIIEKELHFAISGFDESIFIGEDQYYCEQAAKLKKFRIIKSSKIYFSDRRFEKVGPWRMFHRLVYSSFYVLIFGPIRKKIIDYDFGDFD